MKCHRYWPDMDNSELGFGSIIVTLLSETVHGTYIERCLNLRNSEKKQVTVEDSGTQWSVCERFFVTQLVVFRVSLADNIIFASDFPFIFAFAGSQGHAVYVHGLA